MLLKFLIFFFGVLIFVQLYNSQSSSYSFSYSSFVEGMETQTTPTIQYQSYSGEDPLILAKQNAGNIEFLKSRVDELSGINQKVADLSSTVADLNIKVNTLVQQQQSIMQSIAPSNVSGLT
jgi:hypothetical protein